VAAAESPAALDAIAGALRSFLTHQALPPGYVETSVGGYRALCRPPAAGGAWACSAPLLLASEDGAAYLPAHPALPGGPPSAAPHLAAHAALRANRYQPTGGTLAIRLPATCGGGTGTYDVWASPRYRAAAGQAEPLWK